MAVGLTQTELERALATKFRSEYLKNEGNPMGARALYLGNTEYRIHGTNQPSTIGQFVSSGCIRLTNEDVQDLYNRVTVGTRVVVLPNSPPISASAEAGIAR